MVVKDTGRQSSFYTIAGVACMLFAGISQAYEVNIEEAIEIGLSNSQARYISREDLAIAEEQHKQALSTYWPTLDLNAAWDRHDEDVTFTLNNVSLTAQTPLGPLPATVPEAELTLFDRDLAIYSVDLFYPIYTGGKLSSIRRQAKIGVDIAEQAVRRGDDQIVYDIKKYYYGALLAKALRDIGEATWMSVGFTRDITKKFIERGSQSVTQRDYLQTEMAVASLEGQVSNFLANYQSAIAALKLVMGLNYDDNLTLKEDRLQEITVSPELAELVEQAHASNTDIRTLALSVEYADEKIREQKSGYMPKFAFTATGKRFVNSFDGGLVNDRNEDTWIIGIKMNMPLFNGFRTRAEVNEASHRKSKIQAQKILVEQSVATQIQNYLIELGRASAISKTSKRGVDFSQQHTQLTDYAYRNNIVETEDVVRAKIYESMLRAQHMKALHDVSYNLSSLEYVVGTSLEKD